MLVLLGGLFTYSYALNFLDYPTDTFVLSFKQYFNYNHMDPQKNVHYELI